MSHVTVGVYNNGDFVINIVDEKDLNGHIEYNTIFRFGRALFVDGKCFYSGYLKEEEIVEWKNKISNMEINKSKISLKYL